MQQNRWIDITMPLTNDMGVWPGDTSFTYQLTYSYQHNGLANVGEFTTSVHAGTHLDAPYHYDPNGTTIDQMDVSLFIGPALVVDVRGHKTIGRSELETFDLDGVTRLLLRSFDRVDQQFPEWYPVLREDIGPFLQEKGIHLIGTDCPSVDPVESESLSAHHSLHHHGIYIMENLILKDVEAGNYQLIALPLSIAGGDASPVRAVLKKTDE
ncbi:arylformamidase [Aquibacillus sediminis]|uniref:arylformamidase n=1 Tax=Aquibacillus sediminis TaxID=2574734 RepID=UPI0011087C09|nr:arylformamidase [Aquibacillus sediminis]